VREVSEVETKDPFPLGAFTTLESAHENQEREEPFLVPARSEKPPDFRKLQRVEASRLLAQRRNRDSEKPVALAVLARPGLEEPG